MENGALVPQVLGLGALLTSAQNSIVIIWRVIICCLLLKKCKNNLVPEVLGSARADIRTKGDLNTSSRTAANGNIEENNRVGHDDWMWLKMQEFMKQRHHPTAK